MVHRPGAHLARAVRARNMILDDGGDATLLVHKGAEYEKAGAVPSAAEDDPEELEGRPRPPPPYGRRLRPLDRHRRAHQGRDRGDHHRRPPAVRDGQGRHPRLPGDQRQRLGDQVEVRQQVRLPPQRHRRPQPRHRRAHRRQGRGRLRLRRRGQGLLGRAARPGRPRHRHRDRPDLRAAGRDGRLPGHDAGGRRRDRRHLRDDDRQLQHHHRRPHGADEAPGDRQQHRPLRQRDRHRRPGEDPGHQEGRGQAAGPHLDLRGRPAPSSCWPRAA